MNKHIFAIRRIQQECKKLEKLVDKFEKKLTEGK